MDRIEQLEEQNRIDESTRREGFSRLSSLEASTQTSQAETLRRLGIIEGKVDRLLERPN